MARPNAIQLIMGLLERWFSDVAVPCSQKDRHSEASAILSMRRQRRPSSPSPQPSPQRRGGILASQLANRRPLEFARAVLGCSLSPRERIPRPFDALCGPEPQVGPLTPALSPSEGERGNRRQLSGKPRFRSRGQGEGEENARFVKRVRQRARSPHLHPWKREASVMIATCSGDAPAMLRRAFEGYSKGIRRGFEGASKGYWGFFSFSRHLIARGGRAVSGDASCWPCRGNKGASLAASLCCNDTRQISSENTSVWSEPFDCAGDPLRGPGSRRSASGEGVGSAQELSESWGFLCNAPLFLREGTVGGALPTRIKGSLSAEPLEVSYPAQAIGTNGQLEVRLLLQWSARRACSANGQSFA